MQGLSRCRHLLLQETWQLWRERCSCPWPSLSRQRTRSRKARNLIRVTSKSICDLSMSFHKLSYHFTLHLRIKGTKKQSCQAEGRESLQLAVCRCEQHRQKKRKKKQTEKADSYFLLSKLKKNCEIAIVFAILFHGYHFLDAFLCRQMFSRVDEACTRCTGKNKTQDKDKSTLPVSTGSHEDVRQGILLFLLLLPLLLLHRQAQIRHQHFSSSLFSFQSKWLNQ